MTRSPLRLFFFSALLFAIAGSCLNYYQHNLFFKANNVYQPSQELVLARYYQRTGQIEKAISEYKDVIDLDVPDSVKVIAYKELAELIDKQDSSFLGKLESYGAYAVWFLVPKLFGLSVLFFFLWLIVLLIKPFIKKSELVIFPLHDFSGLKIGEALPQLTNERLRELKWRFQNLENSNLILSETLDVPIMGVIGDVDAVDISAIVETALMLSGGPTSLPLTRILDSLRLWFGQPKYIVSGNLEGSRENLTIHLLLIDREKQTVIRTWVVKLEGDNKNDLISQVVDVIIYPLLYNFTKKKSTQQWESFKALCDSLENIDLYTEKRYDVTYLNKARDTLEKAIEIDPNYDLAKYNLGLLLLRLGEYELARDKFKELSTLSPNEKLRDFSQYSYAVALFELSQEWAYKRAIEVLLRLIEEVDNKEVVQKARGVLSITYARMSERENDLREHYANLALEQARVIKSDRIATKSAVATALAAEGYVQIILGKKDDAIISFEQSVEKDSENISSWIGLGNAYFGNNQKEKAISAFRKAADLSPSSGYSYYRLGNIYRDIGDFENAIEAFKLAPQIALAHLAIGKIYLSRQEYESALDEFRKAVVQNKRLVDGWLNIAWTICEADPKDQELIKEAEASARRGLQLEQNQSLLWHRYAILARVLLLAGKKEKALNAIQEAIKLSPNQPQANYYYAMVEYDLGHPDKAIELARKVLDQGKGEWARKAQMLISAQGAYRT
ncbi:MAG: tetratricopeptide repeat protein [Anaerolineae bacterium]|nr:tetratricopeptide repeat protein [Anaerolineae bacterium]